MKKNLAAYATGIAFVALTSFVATSGCGSSTGAIQQPVAPLGAFHNPNAGPLTAAPPMLWIAKPPHDLPPDVGYAPEPVFGHPGLFRLQDGNIIVGPHRELERLGVGTNQVAVPLTASPTPYPCTITPWNWNGTPPPCDKTGPFRRVYSDTNGYYASLAENYIPAEAAMPTSAPYRSTGYTYYGFYTRAGDNAEYGLFFDQKSNAFIPYEANSTNKFLAHPSISIPVNNWIEIWAGLDWMYNFNTKKYTVTGMSAVFYVWNGSQWVEKNPISTSPIPSGFTTVNCCKYTRMTTIGQSENQFKVGVEFSNLNWYASALYYANAGGSQYNMNWLGTTNFPTDSSIIIVNYVNLDSETDTINLHK